MSTIDQRLLEILRKIRDEGVPLKPCGLCWNVQRLSAELNHDRPRDMSDRVFSLAYHWPQTHGSAKFPVGGASQFEHESQQGTLWNNPRRHEFLHWLIQHLENAVCPQ